MEIGKRRREGMKAATLKTFVEFSKFCVKFERKLSKFFWEQFGRLLKKAHQEKGCCLEEIHDRGYKKLFSNLEIFRQLIISFVHEPWVKDLNFSKCELVKGSFVSTQYKRTFSDLIYKVKLRGRDLYIVILVEFKATPPIGLLRCRYWVIWWISTGI